MDLLLDTKVVIWALTDSDRLRAAIRDTIENPLNPVFVSIASAWEIAIKVALRKLNVPKNVADWLPKELAAVPFAILPISMGHVLAVAHLPLHHHDPFDRLLIAQAKQEGLTLVTADARFDAYPISVLRC